MICSLFALRNALKINIKDINKSYKILKQYQINDWNRFTSIVHRENLIWDGDEFSMTVYTWDYGQFLSDFTGNRCFVKVLNGELTYSDTKLPDVIKNSYTKLSDYIENSDTKISDLTEKTVGCNDVIYTELNHILHSKDRYSVSLHIYPK